MIVNINLKNSQIIAYKRIHKNNISGLGFFLKKWGKMCYTLKKNRGGRNTQINKTIRIYIEST